MPRTQFFDGTSQRVTWKPKRWSVARTLPVILGKILEHVAGFYPNVLGVQIDGRTGISVEFSGQAPTDLGPLYGLVDLVIATEFSRIRQPQIDMAELFDTSDDRPVPTERIVWDLSMLHDDTDLGEF